jgi:hypothetical protein
MKLKHMLWLAAVLIIPANVWAYGDSAGSGSGTGMCKKVNFSEFSPVNNSEVAPQSAFSFYATESTFPKSIKVTIKGQSIPLTVVEKQNGYKVTGKLPDTLDGWLVKVTQ